MELWLSVGRPDLSSRDLVVRLDPSHAVADLAVALNHHLDPQADDVAPGVHRAGEVLDPSASVAEAGLQRGDELLLVAQEEQAAPQTATPVALVAVGGPCTGARWPLLAGTWTLGRDPDVDFWLDDPFASRRHLRLEVRGDTGEVLVTDLGSANGTMRDGEALSPATRLAPGDVIEVGSTQLAIRGPSERVPAPEPPLAVAVDASLEGLPVERRALRRASVDLAEARRQLEQRTPGVVELAERIPHRALRDDQVLRVGFGTVAAWHGSDRVLVPSAPLTLDLDDVASVACAGPDPDGLARGLLLQLAAAHAPDELSIAVAGGAARTAHWGWAAWLPHTRTGRPGVPTATSDLLAFDLGEAATLVRSLHELTRHHRVQGHRWVVVLDATLPLTSRDLPGADELRRAGMLLLWVGSPEVAAEIHVVPSGEDGSVTIVGPGDRAVHGDGADHLDAAGARRLALAIARRDHQLDESLPSQVGLDEAIGPLDVASLSERWAAAAPLAWTLGIGREGPVTVEMRPASPHLVIAGRNRSGGSTTLRTSIAGLAAVRAPADLGMVLVGHDIRAFGPLTDLPHVAAVVTEHASGVLARTLSAELESRREFLARMSARSLPALRAAGAEVPPSLVLVIDGLDGEGAAAFTEVLRDGPELDVHVIASLTGVESRGSLAGFANRVQLRTTDAGESLDVLGTTVGTTLPVDRMGRAFVRIADGPPQLVQIASAAVPRQGRDEILVTNLQAGRVAADGHTALARTPVSDQDLLAELVAVTQQAAATLGDHDWSGWLGGQVPDARQRKTFMFTDIVGSTDLVHAIGDEAWTRLLAWHDESLRRCFEDHGGIEVGNAGDGFFVAFADPVSATNCAIEIQRLLDHHRNTAGFAPQVRIGVHEAEAQQNGTRFTGHGVHVAARVGGVGGASEIVASLETARLAGATTSHPRSVEAKGVPEPLDIVTVQWRD